MKKVCIIHTTPSTIISLKPIYQNILMDCEVYNLLDDSILPDINKSGEISTEIRNRVLNLINSANIIKPDAILIACSTIGEVAEDSVKFSKAPIIRIDYKMCKDAILKGSKIGVSATLNSTMIPTTNLIQRLADEEGKDIEITKVIIDANSLLNEGKTEEYDQKVSSELKKLKKDCDVVVLAQASMARALELIDEDKESYLTSPVSGMEFLKCYLSV